jgi:hypothetical protein
MNMFKISRKFFSKHHILSENKHLAKVQTAIGPHQNRLMAHPLYSSIHNLKETQIFMENHVFAVWDFMSLVKTLQNVFTCTTIPWVPRNDPKLAHFLNQIVLGEECDDLGTNEATTAISHYHLYLKSMKEIEANVEPAEFFINSLKAGVPWKEALKTTEHNYKNENINTFTYEFVKRTISLCESSEPHVVASSFLFGREDPIPKMFTHILGNLSERKLYCPNFKIYLERHIEVDGGLHSILGEKLICDVCGTDEKKWKDAEEVAIESIKNRIKLWDGVLESLYNAKN